MNAAAKIKHVARWGVAIVEELEDVGCAGDLSTELVLSLNAIAGRIEAGNRQVADLIAMRQIADASAAVEAFAISRGLRTVVEFLSRPRLI